MSKNVGASVPPIGDSVLVGGNTTVSVVVGANVLSKNVGASVPPIGDSVLVGGNTNYAQIVIKHKLAEIQKNRRYCYLPIVSVVVGANVTDPVVGEVTGANDGALGFN